jgi:energy-coupling factor transporter ATP-binding protein EcfA2
VTTDAPAPVVESAPEPPVVWIERGALANTPRVASHPAVNLALGAGLQAIVGTPADATLDIATLVSGIIPRRAGTVTVSGRDPVRDPALRGRIGVTFDTPCLPPTARVKDLFALLPFGAPTAAEALARFGLGHWSDRRARSLAHRERRALELVVALSIPSPIAIVLTEPAADIADIDRDALKHALARAADGGACVAVVTASVADAIEFAPRIHVMEAGRLVRSVAANAPGDLVPGRGVILRIEVDLPRLLAGALADDPAVAGIDWGKAERSILSVRGDDLDRLALAVARAAGSSGVTVRSIVPVAPGIDEVRAASAGLASAAYQAAYQAWATASSAEPPREGQP